MSEFLSDEASAADLVSRMPPEEQVRFNRYGHLRIESAFAGRIFVVYKPTGLNALKEHRQPDILTTIRLTDFRLDSQAGGIAWVVDEDTGCTAFLDHTPRPLFTYDIFMWVPPRMHVRWDARRVGGQIERSLSFAVLVKTKNRADFYSAGNTYCETPNEFRKLYPNVTGAGRLIF